MTSGNTTATNPFITAPKAGPGRPAGLPNKVRTNVREALVEAFERTGGADGLVQYHSENPDGFYNLLKAIIPSELVVDVNLNVNFTKLLIEAMEREKAAEVLKVTDGD